MDSTLIDQEIIDELARSVGLTAQVSAITARAMNGEIGFESSLRERVGMLKGVRESVWEELKGRVTVAEGAKELVGFLRGRGCMTGVVSGGFAPMAEWLGGELGLDFVVANHVCVALCFGAEEVHVLLSGECEIFYVRTAVVLCLPTSFPQRTVWKSDPPCAFSLRCQPRMKNSPTPTSPAPSPPLTP